MKFNNYILSNKIANNNPTVKEFAEIMKVSARGVQRNCVNGKYPYETYTSIKGKPGYRIVIDKLPPEVKCKYLLALLEKKQEIIKLEELNKANQCQISSQNCYFVKFLIGGLNEILK